MRKTEPTVECRLLGNPTEINQKLSHFFWLRQELEQELQLQLQLEVELRVELELEQELEQEEEVPRWTVDWQFCLLRVLNSPLLFSGQTFQLFLPLAILLATSSIVYSYILYIYYV